MANEKQSSGKRQQSGIASIPKETAGAVAGAALGSVVGPIGAVVGGVAGAIAGKASAAGKPVIPALTRAVKNVTPKPASPRKRSTARRKIKRRPTNGRS